MCHLKERETSDTTENLGDMLHSKEWASMHKAEDTNPIQNFDKYLDTLDDLLGMPHTGITPCDDVTRGTSMDNKIEWCKKKLSSFLVVDFRSLVSCNDDIAQHHNFVKILTLVLMNSQS